MGVQPLSVSIIEYTLPLKRLRSKKLYYCEELCFLTILFFRAACFTAELNSVCIIVSYFHLYACKAALTIFKMIYKGDCMYTSLTILI